MLLTAVLSQSCFRYAERVDIPAIALRAGGHCSCVAEVRMGRIDADQFTCEPCAEEMLVIIAWCRELIETSAVPRSLAPLLYEAQVAFSAGELGAAYRLLLVVLTASPNTDERAGREMAAIEGPWTSGPPTGTDGRPRDIHDLVLRGAW